MNMCAIFTEINTTVKQNPHSHLLQWQTILSNFLHGWSQMLFYYKIYCWSLKYYDDEIFTEKYEIKHILYTLKVQAQFFKNFLRYLTNCGLNSYSKCSLTFGGQCICLNRMLAIDRFLEKGFIFKFFKKFWIRNFCL